MRIGLLLLLWMTWATHGLAQVTQRVIDLPTRPQVEQRLLVLSPPDPKAAAILFGGGHGGLMIFPNGTLGWGDNNFLVRTRQMFADQGLMVVLVDAPSDRRRPPFLSEFRHRPEHVADIQAVIAWIRNQAKVPVWLVGTSRGTQSAAHVATALSGPDGPDGLVLTSSILTDDKTPPVPAMPLGRLRIPVLVVHHEQDACRLCMFGNIEPMMKQLESVPRKQLLAFRGGDNRGDPCAAWAYHGFNGLETEVVAQSVAWMLAR